MTTTNPACANCGHSEDWHYKEGVCIHCNFAPVLNPCKKFITDNKGYTNKCPYTGKKGYIQEDDCHCFCCGTHEGSHNQNCAHCWHTSGVFGGVKVCCKCGSHKEDRE